MTDYKIHKVGSQFVFMLGDTPMVPMKYIYQDIITEFVIKRSVAYLPSVDFRLLCRVARIQERRHKYGGVYYNITARKWVYSRTDRTRPLRKVLDDTRVAAAAMRAFRDLFPDYLSYSLLEKDLKYAGYQLCLD